MSKQFKIGDTVRLKAGGPLMEVQKYNNESTVMSDLMVSCFWYDKHGNLIQDVFHQDQLVKRRQPQVVFDIKYSSVNEEILV